MVTLAGCASADPDRATLEDLAGPEWVLQEFAPGDPAPAEPAITLALDDGRAVGSSGCNRYFTALTSDPDQPGSLSTGPVGATRMACSDEINALEMRFLAALEGASSFRIEDGKLLLAWSRDSDAGVLVFERTPQEGPS
jgi:heat shock protein HslJ